MTAALLALAAVQAWAGSLPGVAAVLDAIRTVESSGQPYLIRDNTAGRVFKFDGPAEALAQAKTLLALHHSLDLGLYQINSVQLERPGVSIESIFDPGVQRELAAQVFGEFYAASRSLNPDPDTALWRAVGAYNLGTAGFTQDHPAYTNRVRAVLGLAPLPVAARGGSVEAGARIGEIFSRGLGWPSTDGPADADSALEDPLQGASEIDNQALAESSDPGGSSVLALLTALACLFVVAKLGLWSALFRLVAVRATSATARAMRGPGARYRA